jgi:uncharacterized membrane protein required for colicin V production
MSLLDWILLGFVALAALAGFRSGLVATALSFAGLVAGAVLGARVAPELLSPRSRADYAAIAALAGGLVGAVLLRALVRHVAVLLRGGLRMLPPLRLLDSIGGAVVGAAWGLVLVWVVGAAITQLPKDTRVRQELRTSQVIDRLNEFAPPPRILRVGTDPRRPQLEPGR